MSKENTSHSIVLKLYQGVKKIKKTNKQQINTKQPPEPNTMRYWDVSFSLISYVIQRVAADSFSFFDVFFLYYGCNN